ncbi:MAG: biotin--[acetyl-CoA-carboxylase] ligase [Eubacterium sp.]
MSVKAEVLAILEANHEEHISGEDMAARLAVSRTSIWKAIKTLREEGYKIEAVNNRGYRLSGSSDLLNEKGIALYLTDRASRYPIEVHKILDSTNTECKRRVIDGAPHGLTILAEEQTDGRGRLGRSFYSPAKTGIYVSILVHPTFEGNDAMLLTTAASVAVCRGISKVLHKEPQIKWVNDVYLNEKKICGILTEAISDFEMGKIDSVIIGIGINYRTEEFPEDIKHRAGSLENGSGNVPRNQLVAAVLNEFWEIYDTLEERKFIKEYRERSMVIGQRVRLQEQGEWKEATALDVDDNGGLIVRMEEPDGTTYDRVLQTGEITLRLNTGQLH